MDLACTNFPIFVILIILIIIAPAEEEGTLEVLLAAAGSGMVVTDVAVGTGMVVPEATVRVGTVEPDATVADAEGWVDAGIPDYAVVPEVVPAKDEGGSLDGASHSDTRWLAVDAGKADRNAHWTVSSTSYWT